MSFPSGCWLPFGSAAQTTGSGWALLAVAPVILVAAAVLLLIGLFRDGDGAEALRELASLGSLCGLATVLFLRPLLRVEAAPPVRALYASGLLVLPGLVFWARRDVGCLRSFGLHPPRLVTPCWSGPPRSRSARW